MAIQGDKCLICVQTHLQGKLEIDVEFFTVDLYYEF